METKTITAQLQDIVDAMCNDYCRYPREWDDADGELCESDICSNCPLNKLV